MASLSWVVWIGMLDFLMTSTWTRLLLSLSIATCLSNFGNAQTTISGALAGVVSDPVHAVVPNADVEIKDPVKGITGSTRTDPNGVYEFFFLTPGRYTLVVKHAGFRDEKREVDVPLGPPVSVNVTLEIAKATSLVNVTAQAPLVQAENGDVSATMSQKQVSELPNPGNDLTYIVQTAPGVVMNTDVQTGANFSILGMPGFSYLHTIDGMNDNDNEINLSQVGALILLLGQNEVQEVTVVSTGYSGQFGGAAGGNINYLTKSGDNQFHGNAQYYWNGRLFNANNWFNKAFDNPRPFSIANQWSASFGGPIKKDKLFFFFDTEGLRLLIPQQFFVLIPSPQFEAATLGNIDSKFGATSAADAFYREMFGLYKTAPGASSAVAGGFDGIGDPTGCTGFSGLNGDPCALHFVSSRGRPSQDTLVSGRFDWNIGAKDRAFLRLQYDRGRGAIGTDPINPGFDVDLNQPWWQGQLNETHSFGSSGASQFLLAGSYFAPIFQAENPAQALSAFPTTLSFASGTFTNLGTGFVFGFGKYSNQYQVSEDIIKAHRSHRFGFGASLARIHWSELPNKLAETGQLGVQTLDAFFQGGIDSASPETDFTSLTQSFTSQTNLPISFLGFAAYVEDEWQVRPGLSLTLALRAEHYSNPVCRSRCFATLAGPFDSVSHDPAQPYNQAILSNQERAFEEIDSILWSPRFSFAWQPTLSHNTVLRGGMGLFYDPLPGRLLNSFSSNPPLLNSYTVVGDSLTPDKNAGLFKDADSSNQAFISGFSAGQTLADIQGELQKAGLTFFPPAISTSEKRTHSPQFQRWSLELQQSFGSNSSISIGYFGHHGVHELTQNPNANAYGFGSLPAGLCSSPPVPPCADPRFSGVTELTTNAVSNYNGLVASFRHRFSSWAQGLFQANYTYGHALDENSSGGIFIFHSLSLTSPQDPNNLRGSYGSADHDVRHSFNANYVWELPIKAVLLGHGWDALVKGWQVSGTIFARTGFPYTVFDFEKSGSLVGQNYFGLLYAVPASSPGADLSCGKGAAVPQAPHPCQPPQVLFDGDGNPTTNPSASFVQAGCETGFNIGHLGASGVCDGRSVTFAQGRNRYRGPAYFNTDFTILKSTKLPGWENATLGVGFQFFNLLNHPNFGFPDPGLSSPTFGQILGLEQPPTSILGSGFGGNASPRMIQLKVELKF